MATTRATPTAKKPKAMFSIAAAEKEWADTERPEPFTVDLPTGEVITLVDPLGLSWQKVASLSRQQPWVFLQTVVDTDDLDKFYEADFNIAVLNKLMDAYIEHYGLEVTPGE